jgi:hypothetical protein
VLKARGNVWGRQVLWLALMLALPLGGGNLRWPWDQAVLAQQGTRAMGGFDDSSNSDPLEEEKRLRALNTARQKSIVSDTNKLLKLAGELDAEIGHANGDSLTPEQLRKVAEIEKLAHSVKEKMSTPVTGNQDFKAPFSPLYR